MRVANSSEAIRRSFSRVSPGTRSGVDPERVGIADTRPASFGICLVPQYESPELLAERAEVVVWGDVDLATSPRMRRVLSDVLNKGSLDIVIDMEAVAFIDASGIGVLAEIANSAHSRGGQVVLRRPSRMVLRVLDIIQLRELLPLEGPVETPS
jgi:anti-sigma B factor antagonist